MKLSVERSYLLKAISQAQSVVERRNTIPILSNVLLETNSSRIKEIKRRIKSREKKIVFDFSIATIIHFSLFIAIDRFEPPSA